MMFFSLYNGFKNVTCKATIAHLTGEKLKETIIPLPNLELQNRFAAIVTKVEFVKDHYIKSLNKLEFLCNAVNQKAFKGELDLWRVPLNECNNANKMTSRLCKSEIIDTERKILPFLYLADYSN
jgi:type I restriction enzyme, S subunit